MPELTMLSGKTDTGESDAFPCAGYSIVQVRIWSDEANPDATLDIEAGGSPWFSLNAATDLSSMNPSIWSVPPTDQVRVNVLTNASGKAVNATLFLYGERV